MHQILNTKVQICSVKLVVNLQIRKILNYKATKTTPIKVVQCDDKSYKYKANLRHKPTITNVCFRHLRREKTHFVPFVLAKIAKQNVNLPKPRRKIIFLAKTAFKIY